LNIVLQKAISMNRVLWLIFILVWMGCSPKIGSYSGKDAFKSDDGISIYPLKSLFCHIGQSFNGSFKKLRCSYNTMAWIGGIDVNVDLVGLGAIEINVDVLLESRCSHINNYMTLGVFCFLDYPELYSLFL